MECCLPSNVWLSTNMAYLRTVKSHSGLQQAVQERLPEEAAAREAEAAVFDEVLASLMQVCLSSSSSSLFALN